MYRSAENKASESRIIWSGSIKRDKIVSNFDRVLFSAAYTDDERIIISNKWKSQLKDATSNGRVIYNSEIFRLAELHSRDGTLVFSLGLTNYMEYVATRSPSVDMPRADPIGTCIVPITNDGFIPLGRRSLSAEVNPGKFFTFGGFFDANLDWQDGAPDVFACIRREINEELGISVTASALSLIGVVYDEINLHPEISFTASLDVHSTEFCNLKWQAELNDITFVKLSDVAKFIEKFNGDFTPTIVGALEILQRQKFGFRPV